MLYKTKKLLGINADAKTKKGAKNGVLTGILYMTPEKGSGYQVCPKASKECVLLCLNTAGRGVMSPVQTGRLNKTLWFFKERDTFMAQLVDEIEALEKRAAKLNMTPAVRLNGTSDLPYEKIACVRNGVGYSSVMDAFPNIQFYDYTKILGRSRALSLPNYHLTFSLSEDNDEEAVQALAQGYNVAVVIKGKEKPDTWSGYPAIDGDLADHRFLDEKGGHVVLLSAKGKARYADYGFVRPVNGGFNVPATSRIAA